MAADAAKVTVAENASNGTLATAGGFAAGYNPGQATQNMGIPNIAAATGIITVQTTNKAGNLLLTMTPFDGATGATPGNALQIGIPPTHQVVWACSTTGQFKYVPANCRQAAATALL